MTKTTRCYGRGSAARSALLVFTAAILLPAAGCSIDDLLSVDDPDVATPGSLTGAQALPAILSGARSDFQVAFSGTSGSEGQVTYSGLFTDELQFVESFDTRLQIDKRAVRIDNSNVEAVFRNVMRARTSTETAVERFVEFDPDTEGHASALNLAGYSYIMVGENYCSGIPFSRLSESGATEYGEPETTTQIFQRAIARFEDAIDVATAAGDDDLLNLARVGLGRAYLNLEQYADAATAVENVPTEFEYVIEHSENTPRQYNGIFSFTHTGRRFGVSESEGGVGLPFRTAMDPRVPWVQQGIAWDGSSLLYRQLKYPTRSAGVPLASGIEARLIEAEAEFNGTGGAAAMYLILNTLRSDAGITPGLTPAATPTGQQDDLFSERAFWLYLTGHRLGDLRRLVRQYDRVADTVYPSGEYWKQGQSYGTDLSFPLPQDEAGNPNYLACDVTMP